MSFLGISPGQGSRFALERLLKSRTDDPVAKYLLLHGEWFTGRVLPERHQPLQGAPTHCHANTMAACQRERRLRAYTGLYSVAPIQNRSEAPYFHHSWAVDDEGVVEVTFPTVVADPSQAFMSGHGQMSAIPWIEPRHWCYLGCEFEADFLDEFCSQWGLPVFDPVRREGLDRLLAAPYAKRPFDPSA